MFDKQDPEASAAIRAVVHHPFESTEKGFENTVLLHTAETALYRYALNLVAENVWPNHLIDKTPTAACTADQIREALWAFFSWAKGSGDAGDLLGICVEAEMPAYVREVLRKIYITVEPPVLPPPPPAAIVPLADDDDEL